MINKKIEDIKLDDVQDLIESRAPEARTLEYKSELPADTDSDKKEFLADVSSFANSIGGDLIFGIKAQDGIPIQITPIIIENEDKYLSKYESIIRDGIEPRINVVFKLLNVTENRYFILIRIEKSWIPPHRVIYKGHDKFYSRNSNGKYSLDTYELRNIFNSSLNLNENIRNICHNRINKIMLNECEFDLNEYGKLHLLLIPFESVYENKRYDILQLSNLIPRLSPMLNSVGCNHRINLDGFITYFQFDDRTSVTYTQLYRNGMIEALCENILYPYFSSNEYKINSRDVEKELIDGIKSYVVLLKEMAIICPIAVSINLLNISKYVFIGNDRGVSSRDQYNHPILETPIAVINSFEDNIEQVLRPSFDAIWNAYGYNKSPNFDSEGNWG